MRVHPLHSDGIGISLHLLSDRFVQRQKRVGVLAQCAPLFTTTREDVVLFDVLSSAQWLVHSAEVVRVFANSVLLLGVMALTALFLLGFLAHALGVEGLFSLLEAEF